MSIEPYTPHFIEDVWSYYRILNFNPNIHYPSSVEIKQRVVDLLKQDYNDKIVVAYSILRSGQHRLIYDRLTTKTWDEQDFSSVMSSKIDDYSYYVDEESIYVDQEEVVDLLSLVATCFYELNIQEDVRAGFTSADTFKVIEKPFGTIYLFSKNQPITLDYVAYVVTQNLNSSWWLNHTLIMHKQLRR